LPKCHFFQALGNVSLFADLTHDRFVSGGHRPSSPYRRPDSSVWVIRFEGMCEPLHTPGRI
jgi:hypothetical protein